MGQIAGSGFGCWIEVGWGGTNVNVVVVVVVRRRAVEIFMVD